jgi:hypothetical protein
VVVGPSYVGVGTQRNTQFEGDQQLRTEKTKECIARFHSLLSIVSPGWVAGGCLRDYFSGEPLTSDIDVFFANDNDFNSTVEKLKFDKRFTQKYAKDKLAAYDYRGTEVQLIGTHFFASAKETSEAFDFTICCAAVDLNEVYVHENFFEDLAGKRIAINKLPFPMSSLERLCRYSRKGYTACNGSLLEIVKAIQKVDLENKAENGIEFYSNGSPRFIRFD